MDDMKPFIMLLVVPVLLGAFIGHWSGYWHGRTYQLYECSKKHGIIDESMTWGQFLNEIGKDEPAWIKAGRDLPPPATPER